MTIDGVKLIQALIYNPKASEATAHNEEISEFDSVDLNEDDAISYTEFCSILGLDYEDEYSQELYKSFTGGQTVVDVAFDQDTTKVKLVNPKHKCPIIFTEEGMCISFIGV